jgi:hypothetical protein
MNNFITEDGIVNWVLENNGILWTRKHSNIGSYDLRSCSNIALVCLTGYEGIVAHFFSSIINKINKPVVLVTLETDGFNMRDEYLQNELLVHWFSWNKPVNHSKLSCLPIGLNLDRQGIVMEPFIEENEALINNTESRKWLYFNCSLNTNCGRSSLENLAGSWAGFCDIVDHVPFQNTYRRRSHTDGSIVISVTDPQCYKNMLDYKFILSPFGTGLDCHRTWESLYLNCIPIVLTSPINEIFDGLPVVIVDSWNCINLEFLEEKYSEIESKKKNEEYCLDKMYLNYWLSRIEGHVIGQ